MDNFENRFAKSVWAKRFAQTEGQKEFWLRVGDAVGAIALFASLIAAFYLIHGFGG